MAEIYKRGKTWTYRVWYRDATGKRRSKTKGGFSKKSIAEIEASDIEKQKIQGANLATSDTLITTYYDQWCHLYKDDKFSTATTARYRGIGKVIAQYFPNKKLVSLSKSDYQQFLNEYGKTRTKSTVQKTAGIFKAMIHNAIDDQIIHSDPTKNAILVGHDSKPSELKYLEINDLKRLINKCCDELSLRSISKYMIVFGALTGCRFGEIGGLTWNDVDFETHQVTINKTIDYKNKTGFKPTKTKSSVRTIAIDDKLISLLKDLRCKQQNQYIKTGYRDPLNLVFRNSYHYYINNDSANKTLLKMERELNIENPITFHGLRHTHASFLISQGVDIMYISQRLGHKNVTMTQKIYLHLLKSSKKAEINKTLTALNNM